MTTQQLTEQYNGMDSEQLLELHQSGKLADWAYPILETEMAKRGESIPARPVEYAVRDNDATFFTDHLQGNRSLGSAFWRVYVSGYLLILLVTLACGRLLRDTFPHGWKVAPAALVIYMMFATFVVWRCARNTNHPVLGWAARLWTLLYTVVFVWAAGLTITQ